MNPEDQPCGVFEEQAGQTSMMRVMCFLALIFGLGFAGLAVWLATNAAFALAAQYAMIFAFGFLGSSIFGKTFQKLAENNPDIFKKQQ